MMTRQDIIDRIETCKLMGTKNDAIALCELLLKELENAHSLEGSQ